jgi:hypothetical protein
MTNITQDTLGNTGPIFFRDVLRYNVSGLGNRVYKSSTGEDLADLPSAVIDFVGLQSKKLTLDGSVNSGYAFSVVVEIYANTVGDRDTLADSIMQVLRTPTSADSNGDTIHSQGFERPSGGSITSSINDFTISGDSKGKGVKSRHIEIEYKYIR